MILSKEQDNALKKVSNWLNDPHSNQVFRLFGYAGTGKTTLAKYFAESVEGTVLFGAYTGKAAHVLRTKGCVGASTIHSMIYDVREKSRSKLAELEQALAELLLNSPNNQRRIADIRLLVEEERKKLSRPIFTIDEESNVRTARLVVIDECSMVDSRMGEDLLSFGCKVLVLGDPAQLPPIKGGGFFTDCVQPDIMLTEIHRQASDNPIIALATMVRNQTALTLGTYGNSEIISKASPDDALFANQILVGKNATRLISNRRSRELRGITDPLPIIGDKLVCLRNNHDKGLLNGGIWQVLGTCESPTEGRICLTILPDEGGDELDVEAHTQYFLGNGGSLQWWERKEAEEFDYGYALTVHKAQGSQWNNVLLFDESSSFRDDRWKWLYTAITRAANSIKIVI
jgi:exodeoxyribonuclease V